MSVEAGNTFTVTLDDASAKITSMTIHVWQTIPDEPVSVPGLPTYFAFGPEPI